MNVHDQQKKDRSKIIDTGHTLELNPTWKEINLELSTSIRQTMSKFFSNVPSRFSTYFTLTFKDIFDFTCKKCINEYYKYGKPTRHFHNVSYGFVNKTAQELSTFFPRDYKIIVVEGSPDYKRNHSIINDIQNYLASGGRYGDTNHKMMSAGRRPHIHGIIHGYDREQLLQILRKTNFITPQPNLSPVKDCTCVCCTTCDFEHDHIRTLQQYEYYDSKSERQVKTMLPNFKISNSRISHHLFSPQPRGRMDIKKPIVHDQDQEKIISYLYKYLYKDLKKSMYQTSNYINTYNSQEELDSHVKIY